MDKTGTVGGRIISKNLFVSSGLLGLSIIAVVQYSSIASLSCALKASAGCFAAAIPTLTLIVLRFAHPKDKSDAFVGRHESLVVVFAYILCAAGLGLLFVHFAWYLGLIFLVSSMVSIALFLPE